MFSPFKWLEKYNGSREAVGREGPKGAGRGERAGRGEEVWPRGSWEERSGLGSRERERVGSCEEGPK